MYKVEIDHTFSRIIQTFYQFGVWRNEEEPDIRKSCMRLLYLIEHISFLVFILTSAFQSDDKNQQIFLVGVGIALTVVIIKLSYLLYRKDEILQFLNDPTVVHSITDFDEAMEVNRNIEKIIKFVRAYALILFVTLFLVVVLPLPIFTSEKMLPMFILFDVEGDYYMILYWLTFLCMSMGCLFGVIYTFSMVFVWYIMYNYSIEYKILGNKFRRVGYVSKDTQKTTTQNSFHEDLIGLIDAQRNLFNTIERFRSCFSTLFLVEIFTGAIAICASTYNLAYITPDNLFQIAFLAVFLLYSFFDIFLVMYLANEITLESYRLSYCLFESNWIEQSEATKKCIVTMGEMIKQPQQLIIFIYPMNLENFSSIVSVAYRMFNILKSSNK